MLRTQLSNLTNGDAAQQAVQLHMEIERLKDEQANTLRQGKRVSRAASALTEEQSALLKEVDVLRAQVAEYKARAPPASLVRS